MSTEKEDHDLLVRIDERVQTLTSTIEMLRHEVCSLEQRVARHEVESAKHAARAGSRTGGAVGAAAGGIAASMVTVIKHWWGG